MSICGFIELYNRFDFCYDMTHLRPPRTQNAMAVLISVLGLNHRLVKHHLAIPLLLIVVNHSLYLYYPKTNEI